MDWLETHQVTVGNAQVGYASLALAAFVLGLLGVGGGGSGLVFLWFAYRHGGL